LFGEGRESDDIVSWGLSRSTTDLSDGWGWALGEGYFGGVGACFGDRNRE
jgi:hypothetical protein